MPTVADIIAWTEKTAGHPLRRDEGVHHGSADREVRQASVCWMATAEVIAEAGRRGDDLIIGHESLYYPYDAVILTDPPPGWEHWAINRRRRERLEKNGLTFLRIHGSADEISIFDDFAALLGLGDPVYAKGWVKVFEVRPCSLDEMVRRVKKATGMERLRVARASDRPVRRIGLPWGGMGLFVNVDYQQQLAEQNCDLFIAGESDCYAFRFATECGIHVIETSHERSENDGLRRFTKMLQEAFDDVKFTFVEVPHVWEIV